MIIKPTLILSLLTLSLGIAVIDPCGAQEPVVDQTNWPWWRGPNRDGVAPSQPQPPVRWSETENILWRTPVPGRGHGSATVMGDQVFLAFADPARESQGVLCFDRATGKPLWEQTVHQGGFDNEGNPNKKSSLASSTIAADNNQLFITFVNQSAVWATALDFAGTILWQKKISDYIIHQGYGSSPAIYQDLVIVTSDNKGGGVIAGLNRETGETVWSRARPKKPNYPSPIIFKIGDRDQLILTGCDLVTSLNPLTGEELWEIAGATTECVTSTVTDGTHIFTSGGYPKNHISAVVADGSGTIAWENNTRAYVPSLLEKDGYLYATLDAGVAVCFRCRDGEPMWKGRLDGTFSSSPVLVGDQIYGTNEAGETFIFKATPERFELLGRNQLGDSVFATPVICDGRIYSRVAWDEGGNRQEYLVCIGQ